MILTGRCTVKKSIWVSSGWSCLSIQGTIEVLPTVSRHRKVNSLSYFPVKAAVTKASIQGFIIGPGPFIQRSFSRFYRLRQYWHHSVQSIPCAALAELPKELPNTLALSFRLIMRLSLEVQRWLQFPWPARHCSNFVFILNAKKWLTRWWSS